MTQDDPIRLVEDGYDALADRYATLESESRPWPRLRWLRRLLDHIDEGERVLDVGCGNGLPATAEIAHRHQAVGIDISAEQIRRARANVSTASFEHVDLSQAEFAEPFAAISAFYVIEHLPRELHAGLFRRFFEWLKPGGLLLMTIEPDDEPGKVGEWLGVPMFFSQHDSETTLALLESAGFEVVETAIEDQFEAGREVTYLWIMAQRSR